MFKQPLIRYALAASLCVGGDAYAQNDKLPDWAPKPQPHIIEDKVRAEISMLGANYATKLRIDPSSTVQGTLIDAEDDLALDDQQFLVLGELTLLPGDNHLVRLSGLSSRRHSQTILERDIIFEDDVYFSDELVDSELNLTMFGLTYGYRFIAVPRAELTASFGIQITEVEANAVVRSRVVRESETGVAPLPLLGLEGRYDFTDQWSVEGRIQYVTANIDDVDGSIMDFRVAVAWRTNPYLVFGLGYRSFTVDIESLNVDTPGLVDMKLSGPTLFMRASL